MIGSALYLVLPSVFGTFSIVWRETEAGPRIFRIFLSNERASSEDLLHEAVPGARHQSHPATAELGERMQRFLRGEPVVFELGATTITECPEFQRRVLIAEYGIRRGWVSTYALIAAHLGVENGARAVGTALARNPFPIIIPCHRAIRSDGHLGGYQGGLAMKRALLGLEGVQVSADGRVLTDRVWYADEKP
jgi:methylated-DNA-[protein]-cysteine S-methyltransferase